MNFVQPSLFDDGLPDLSGNEQPKAQAYRVKPQHVINRFIEFDAMLREAAVWPWDAFRRTELRGRTWPYLLGKLREIGCDAEAAHWEAVMAAHAARLDAATPPEPPEE
jgi:hypothetical protein